MIFITGATGLLGSHVLLELALQGNRIRAARRESSNLDAVMRIFSYYQPERAQSLWGQLEWVEADVMDYYSLLEALDGIEKVYHCAGMVSFDPADFEVLQKQNVEGTANLINACLARKVSKISFASSIAAIGRTENQELIDEGTPWKTSKNNSGYSISKYGAEREVWRGTEEGLPAVIVNPSVIIGPFDQNKSSGQLYQKIKKGLPFYTEGTGGFVDVRDVAKAMVMLMESGIVNERYVMNGANLPYRKVMELIAETIGAAKPRIKTGKFLGGLAWRGAWLASKITGKKPLITKETILSSLSRHRYSSEKIIRQMDFKFISIEEAVSNMCRFFQMEQEIPLLKKD